MSLTEYRTKIHNQHDWMNRALANRCRPTVSLADSTKTPLADVAPAWRDDHVRYLTNRHHRAQEKPSLCMTAEELAAANWADSPAGRCVSGKEGGIASNTGNGYYGKWQADVSFARTYNPEESRLYGPYAYAHGAAWPEAEQDLMAYRGWKARGWYPWPNTAHACGLI